MRRLYADISPGIGWNGRDPEALEVATATQATARTVSSFEAVGVAALLAAPRPPAFLVGGATPAHAPATATVTGTNADDEAQVEVVALQRWTLASGSRVGGAVSARKAFKTITSIAYSAGSGTGATVAIGFGLVPGVRDVRGKIRFEYLLEALGDRSRPGMLDELLVDELCVSASGMIDGKLGTPNGNYAVPFDVAALGDIGRLTLDLWVAEAGKAHPAVIVVDHATLRKDVEREIAMIRKAEAGVGEKPPDPAANVGGAVGAIGAEALYVPPKSFTSSLGDFA